MMETTSTIDERAAQIVEEFSFFDDWLGRYEYLIELGKELPLIDDAYKTDAFRIRGCQSQVWLRPELEDGRLRFKADSDALITKGLIALLVRVLDGESPANVADADLAFLEQIGMNEHLSPTRKNGLNAMVERIRAYARAARESGEIAAPEPDENTIAPAVAAASASGTASMPDANDPDTDASAPAQPDRPRHRAG